jgi:hypothetical protein
MNIDLNLRWTYGSPKNTPEAYKEHFDLIEIESRGETIGIGLSDIDTIVAKLVAMQDEWNKRHYITELPEERFEFIVGNNKDKKFTAKTDQRNDIVIVLWTDFNGIIDATIYEKTEVLHLINSKSWVVV